MKTQFLITQLNNIKDGYVVENKKIMTITKDYTDKLTVIRDGKKQIINVDDVSLYSDTLIFEGEKYRILQSLSKESFSTFNEHVLRGAEIWALMEYAFHNSSYNSPERVAAEGELWVQLEWTKKKLLKDLPKLCCYDKGCQIEKDVIKYVNLFGKTDE